MLYLSAALFCEAGPFIKELKLSKDFIHHKFQIFFNENTKLIVTGTGSVPAACGLTYLLTLYPPVPGDFLISIGICAAADRNMEYGSLFLCNKITEESTGRDFYPDLLFRHPFREASLLTTSRILKNEETSHCLNASLADMEAASIYQCGSSFFQSHEMFFLKIISDYQNPEGLTPSLVSRLVERHVSSVITWVNGIQSSIPQRNEDFSRKEQEKIDLIADSLQLSVTMQFQMRQYCRYYKLLQRDLTKLLNKFYAGLTFEGLPFNKKEGKVYFEQFKSLLMES